MSNALPANRTDNDVTVYTSGGNWEGARRFVEQNFPEARHTGCGYWKMPRGGSLHYFCGDVTLRSGR